jgi:hypothetical protein
VGALVDVTNGYFPPMKHVSMDLKSLGGKPLCRFESGRPHHLGLFSDGALIDGTLFSSLETISAGPNPTCES